MRVGSLLCIRGQVLQSQYERKPFTCIRVAPMGSNQLCWALYTHIVRDSPGPEELTVCIDKANKEGEVLSSLFYRLGTDMQRSSDLPKVAQKVNGRARHETQISCIRVQHLDHQAILPPESLWSPKGRWAKAKAQTCCR